MKVLSLIEHSTIVYVSVVCIHFTIFFGFTFTAAPASLNAVIKRTEYTRNESSRERGSPERKFPGTFVPGSEGSHWELSLRGWKIQSRINREEPIAYFCVNKTFRSSAGPRFAVIGLL